jgi:hypothetical protein
LITIAYAVAKRRSNPTAVNEYRNPCFMVVRNIVAALLNLKPGCHKNYVRI